jgi:type IV pilus assembly protein PilE
MKIECSQLAQRNRAVVLSSVAAPDDVLDSSCAQAVRHDLGRINNRMPILRKTNFQARGFTLIELMVVLAIVAILAAIALPSYSRYVKRSHARSASSDLVALSLSLENSYQQKLAYPVITTTTTSDTEKQATGWHASEDKNFTFTLISDLAKYQLTATGTGSMNGCDLTLGSDNARTVTQGSVCGDLAAW